MTGFIICYLFTNNSKSYVSNTSPILWTNNIEESKIYDTFGDIKYDLECNYFQFQSSMIYTKVHSIWILQYSNNELLWKERFL